MKQKNFAPILSAACLALLCGCNGSRFSKTETSSAVGATIVSESDYDSNNGAPQFADFVGEYPDDPISILTLSDDEIRRIINAQPNFTCAEDLYVNIPKSASVYTFSTYGVQVPQFDYTAAQYKKDFEALFKYLFPDREINPDHLKYSKYIGYDYEREDYIFDEGYVRDNETLPDGVEFIYDETPEGPTIWNNPVYMEMKAELGVGSGVVNKGEAAHLVGKIAFDETRLEWVPADTFIRLSAFEPDDHFESVGRYSPQSEKSFPLLDGEMRICDAAEFFENYVNNAPISTGLQRNTRTSVYSVEVLRINDAAYGYYFTTVPQFQGVNYEPVIYGSRSEYNYDPTGGEAFMIRRGDVDYIHCLYGNEWSFNVEPCKEIVSIETAVKNISDMLTDGVTFEIISVEFVYVQQYCKDELGHINIDTYEANITPAWRITAGNPNDNRTYMCYVDAKDGENFRYYTIPGITNYKQTVN